MTMDLDPVTGLDSVTESVADAIAAYHELLQRSPELAAEASAALVDRQPKEHLTFGGKPLCTVLRPQFLAPSTYSRIQQVCSLLAMAMFRLSDRLVADPELRRPLHLSPAELDLVSVDPGFRPISPTTRLDSFMGGDSWHFVEYNAETPAAIAYQDGLSAVFMDLAVMREFRRRYQVTPLPARQKLLATLLDAYSQWGGRAKPSIAIVDWTGLPTAPEFELFATYFRDQGYEAVIVEPKDLSYERDRLCAGNKMVDLIYRRVLTAELLSQPEVAKPLLRAYRDHRVCVVNSFRAKLLHKKAIFALLTDERYAEHFTADERAAIAAHIPWTREVAEGFTTYGDERVELVPWILDNRERLVLKPNDEYGGKGVVIGWESTPSEWEAGLIEALTAPSVVQERVAVDRIPFPVSVDGELQWPELAADLDPYLFGTEVTGLLTRLSAAALLNVTAGTGSTTPTFVVQRT